MLSDSSSSIRPHDIRMPWEEGVFAEIFGKDEIFSLPKVLSAGFPSHLQEAPSLELATEATARVENHRVVYHDVALAVHSKRKLESFDDKMALLSQRFELLLAHEYSGSSLGRLIKDRPQCERLSLVAEALGGKSVNTLRKRISSATKYVAWCCEQGTCAFPIDADVVVNYTAKSGGVGATFTSISSFLETCRFLHHVLGVDMRDNAVSNPVVQGRMRAARLTRPPRRQARPLSVAEVSFLESFVCDATRALQDRYCAGAFLFAVHSRARLGDLQAIKCFVSDLTDDGGGFLECVLLSHKSRGYGNALGLEMSLVALAKGVSCVSWARVWLDVAKQLQCPEGAPEGSPLLQQPLVSGQWSGIPIRNCSFAKWVASILTLRGMGEGITGHSAKRTALSWASKAGVSEGDGAILGRHSGTSKSVASYSRDLQAGPLRKLAEVYGDIRSGRFKPDLSRSGYYDCQSFDAPAIQVDALNSSDPLHAGESSSWDVAWDKGGQGGELNWYNSSFGWNDVDDLIFEASERAMSEPAAAQESPKAGASESAAQAVGVEESISASSSSSSSSSSGSDLDDALQASAEPVQRGPHPFHERPHCVVYQQRRTRTLHLLPNGSNTNRFLCGRLVGDEHRVFSSSIYLEKWKCRQCEGGKPLRDAGSLNAALDAALKRQRNE